MSQLPRLFVSHSSLDAELTRELCAQLEDTPAQPGYDMLVDYTELKPGVDWPRHLHEYMAHCHAAVLLLTPNSVTSPWVLKEATILAWRRSLDPSFQLFPVRLSGVDDALLVKEKFGPLMLELIQRVDSDEPAAIANAVRARIGRPDAAVWTPFDRLVGRLTDLLSKVGRETLKEIAERLSVEPPAWRPDVDVREQYVRQIARRILTEDLGGFQGVHQLIDALSFTPAPENVKQLFRIIAPYWVDAEAAGRLAPLCQAQLRRAAALNGVSIDGFTALAYVRRAHPLSLRYTLIPIPGGAGGNLLGHVENQICTWLREKEGEQGSDDAIIADLRTRERSYYAVLPGPVDDQSLALILDRFPTLTFILWTGEVLERDPTLTRVDWLVPELDLEKEKQAYRSYRDAVRILNRMESSSL